MVCGPLRDFGKNWEEGDGNYATDNISMEIQIDGLNFPVEFNIVIKGGASMPSPPSHG